LSAKKLCSFYVLFLAEAIPIQKSKRKMKTINDDTSIPGKFTMYILLYERYWIIFVLQAFYFSILLIA